MSEPIPLPRVSEILAATGLGPVFRGVPAEVLARARARGTALHAAIQWHAEGVLDPQSLHPEIAPWFEAYLRFVQETAHVPLASEVEVVHPAWRYVGHIDRIGWQAGRRTLIDFKTTDSLDPAPAVYQLAGYWMAWQATHPTEPLDQALIVQLRSTGTYTLHPVDAAGSVQVFQAALVVYRAQEALRNGHH